MAKITIGGTEYIIPEMNFLSVERAWPFIQRATAELDPMKGISAAIAVIASGLQEVEPFPFDHYGITNVNLPEDDIHAHITHFLKKKIKGNELGAVKDAMLEVLKEAGLEVTEGEAMAALAAVLDLAPEAPTPSTATAPDTSPSSLQPDAKEEAGTP